MFDPPGGPGEHVLTILKLFDVPFSCLGAPFRMRFRVPARLRARLFPKLTKKKKKC